ncbi:hypothetical protein [Acidovorax sp. SDU_ACID1]|uniref:hypothetical protein n=1 Tax=Acidovorax sp. SDU_ACID1 TaxID=3136632 RepID=UPI003873C5F9
MSYRIEYQWVAFRVAGLPLGLSEDRFIVAVEGGDNNLYEANSGRRARSWEACMAGTRAQVMKQAVYFAGTCEGGDLKPHGRDCTPESYIRRIRRLLDDTKDTAREGRWSPRLRVPRDHPAVAELCERGLKPREEQRYGTTCAVLDDVPAEHLGAYFELVERYAGTLHAWSWFEVYGLRAS